MKFFSRFQWGLCLLIWPLWAFAHPFYFSLTQVDHNPQNQSLEVTIKLFTDDIEQALEAQGTDKLYLGDAKEHQSSDRYLTTYLEQHLQFWVNGKAATYQYLGKEVELDVLWAYVEIDSVPELSTVKVLNNLLLEHFEDQQNVVQFRVGNQKESMLLRKGSVEDEVDFE